MGNKYKIKIKLGSIDGLDTDFWTPQDWQEHNEYVKELIKSGDFLKEVEYNVSFVDNKIITEIV